MAKQAAPVPTTQRQPAPSSAHLQEAVRLLPTAARHAQAVARHLQVVAICKAAALHRQLALAAQQEGKQCGIGRGSTQPSAPAQLSLPAHLPHPTCLATPGGPPAVPERPGGLPDRFSEQLRVGHPCIGARPPLTLLLFPHLQAGQGRAGWSGAAGSSACLRQGVRGAAGSWRPACNGAAATAHTG